MKKTISIFSVLFIYAVLIFGSGCSNPYVNPDTSKAITEQEQLKELKEQNAMMKEQTVQLKRIADALEKKTGK